MVMANDDKSKQQSAYMPQSGTQQGSRQGTARSSATQPQQYEGRSLSPRRGATPEPYDYTGYGTSPFRLMRRLNEDLDRLFENFGMGQLFPQTSWPTSGGRFGGQEGVSTLWSPHVEMFEQDGKLVVQADLPGLRKEDVHAQIEDDAVIISGERQQETKNESGTYLSERAYGSFYRVIPLPEGVDAATATATFRDGVLQIEMASPKRQRGRTLEISDTGDTGRTAQQHASGAQSGTGTQQSSGPGSAKQAGSN
jgi:HSP20 family protein